MVFFTKNSKRGGVVNTDTVNTDTVSTDIRNHTFPEQQGFTTQDILWALGIWSVILCLSPVIVFYVLMVA
jgi:flagellar biosynthesis/type III secretory pathway M-ring protein FliF/YscJ